MAQNAWLSELYMSHRRLMLLVAWNIVGDRDVAEDCVQAGIVRLAMLDAAPSHPKAFALSVIRNLALDQMRTAKRRREKSLECTHPIADRLETEDDDARRRAVTEALSALELDQRETVRLHLLGELTFREIGELLGLPLQTVASRYRRAIEKLRSLVESHYDIR